MQLQSANDRTSCTARNTCSNILEEREEEKPGHPWRATDVFSLQLDSVGGLQY